MNTDKRQTPPIVTHSLPLTRCAHFPLLYFTNCTHSRRCLIATRYTRYAAYSQTPSSTLLTTQRTHHAIYYSAPHTTNDNNKPVANIKKKTRRRQLHTHHNIPSPNYLHSPHRPNLDKHNKTYHKLTQYNIQTDHASRTTREKNAQHSRHENL